MKKPWSGRFVKDTDEAVEQFTESVSIDHRLYRQDIRAGVAHAQMLQKCGLITLEDLTAVCEGLARIEQEIDAGSFEFRVPLEDVHMNIEAALIERVGDPGRRLHTARSRNDQVACDMRLWCREAAEGCRARLRECQRALVAKAREYSDAVMPGLTHLQHAQPVLLAHVLLAYVEMFARDDSRLADCGARLNVSPLGACALAGTSLPTDPQSTAEALQFDRCFSNSIDAVSDRDFVIEFAFDLSMIAMHLSRMAEDWVLWASAGLNFVDLDEAYCTGSSIMPQKKNPDVLELMRGRCGRVYGDLLALLTMLKGLPLAYNRDMQEDKAALFDAFDTVDRSLQLAADLVRNAAFKRDNMRNACRTGYLDATSLAEYLVRRGVPFREAHAAVGRAVHQAASDETPLSKLSLDQLRGFCPAIDEDVYDVLGIENCVANYRSHGSSSPAEVERQLAEWGERLADDPASQTRLESGHQNGP
ncbi:MAG: argininosuccinate lyase [Candidatus Brocadiaceae bacterium]|nr:argininosuccinate lyase [Candidatus Brocadiaceae bacterium]